jgi:choloylglycine hydrolase
MKKIDKKILLYVLAFGLFSSSEIFACSAFSFIPDNQVLYGFNFDWFYGDALIVVNKRNVEKERFGFDKTVEKYKWVSKYGSITINQFGREFPQCGMNEAGLVVSVLLLNNAQYPAENTRVAFNIGQWTQYQLDNCATIEEVIATDSKTRLIGDKYLSHVFITDKSGNSVTMEWLKGELVYHKGDTLPVSALTNDTYEDCLNIYLNNKNEPEKTELNNSAVRFYHIADMIKKYNTLSEKSAVNYSFEILESVTSIWYAPEGGTMWSLVYDITNMQFYFMTKENREIRFVDFSTFDFSSASPVMVLNIDSKLSGDVRKYFRKYNHRKNKTLIRNSVKEFEIPISDRFLETFSNFPKTTKNLDRPL